MFRVSHAFTSHRTDDFSVFEARHVDLPDIQLEPPLPHVAGTKRNIAFKRHLVNGLVLLHVAEFFGSDQRHPDLFGSHVLQQLGAQVAAQGVSRTGIPGGHREGKGALLMLSLRDDRAGGNVIRRREDSEH